MNVMLLAAGEGTRLRPYTQILPKPAMPFLNVPLAAHSLNFLQNLPIEHLVVNTYHLPHKIHELFHNLSHRATHLHFSDEAPLLLGSGGGLKKAESFFQDSEDLILMNGDEIILPEDSTILEKAWAHHKSSGALSTLIVMDHPKVGSQFGGVWTDKQNSVLGFGKTPIQGSSKGWHFIGVQILSKKIFQYLPSGIESNILYDAVTQGIQAGDQVQAFPISCTWFETGNPTDFLNATKTCLDYLVDSKETYQKSFLLSTLSRFALPFKVKKTENAAILMGEGCRLSEKAHVEGFAILGNHCVISENTQLHNVVVGDHLQAPPGTQWSEELRIQ